jgi:hypothetical protein
MVQTNNYIETIQTVTHYLPWSQDTASSDHSKQSNSSPNYITTPVFTSRHKHSAQHKDTSLLYDVFPAE